MTEHEKQIQDEISKRLQFAFRKIDNIIREYMIKKNLTEYDLKQNGKCYVYPLENNQGSRRVFFYEDKVICSLVQGLHTDESKHTSYVIDLCRGDW